LQETDGKGFLAETIGEFLELYGTSVLFVVINALVPTIMGLLLLIEKYDSGKTEFNVTITRYMVPCVVVANLVIVTGFLWCVFLTCML